MEELIKKQKSRLKIIAIVFTVIFLLALAFTYLFGAERFFRAEVLQYLGGAPAAAGDYYIPSYVAAPGSVGEIEIVANKQVANLNGLTLDLEYNGTLIEAVKIITDNTPLSGFIKDLNTDIPAGAAIGLAAAEPVPINVGDRIVKVRMQIKETVPQGTEIALKVQNASLIEDIEGKLQSTAIKINPGAITITGTAVAPTLLISSVRPANISNQQVQSIVISGSNFQSDSRVFLGNQLLQKSAQSATSITASVPEGFSPGVHSILVRNTDGSIAKLDDSVIVSKEVVGQISLIEEDFKIVPDRVPNDGTNPVILWVKVKDPLGVSDISTVNADLSNVGGSTTNAMTPGEIIEHTRWYYMQITVPSSVATSDTPYTIPITATNIAGKIAKGNLQLLVTKKAVGSVGPEIVEAYTKPAQSITPGDRVSFFVHVNDNDGIADLQNVVLNLVPIGGEVVKLTPIPVGEGDNPSSTKNKVTDLGAADITSDNPAETKITYQWFYFKNFQLPYDIDPGTYQVKVTASDKSGETGEREISVKISEHQASKIEKIHTRPSKEIAAGEKMNFFVLVRNDSGIKEVKDVIINLIEIGGAPTPMLPIRAGTSQGASVSASKSRTAETEEEATIANTQFVTDETITEGVAEAFDGDGTIREHVTTQWYALIDFRLPLDSQGIYEIPVTVTDKSGATNTKDFILKILSPDELTKFTPKVDEQRSYTNPYVSINDEKTPVTVYVFVRHTTELTNVIMNLRNIGMLAPDKSVTTFTPEDTDQKSLIKADIFSGDLPPVERTTPPPTATPVASCATNSNTILCLEPTAKEGDIGTWFKSPPIVIRKETIASTEPYLVEVTATDSAGRIGQGQIPIVVNDGGKYVVDNIPPKVRLAVATDPETLEILFSEELDPDSVRRDGGNFKITEFADISKKITIKKATLNASATIVTLTTSKQKPGVYYAVTSDTRVTDAVSISMAKGASDRARFIGYQHSRIPPTVRTVTTTGPQTVELVFTAPVKPSSLVLTFIKPSGVAQAITAAPRPEVGHIYYRGENFVIRQSGKERTPLPIFGVNFGDDAHIILLETEIQQPNQEYLLSGGAFASYNGTIIKKGRLNKFFKGYVSKIKGAPTLRRSADFNQDGKVDFLDFTIFATFYGKPIGGEIEGAPEVNPPTTTPPETVKPPAPPAPVPPPAAVLPSESTDQPPEDTEQPLDKSLEPLDDSKPLGTDTSHPFTNF